MSNDFKAVCNELDRTRIFLADTNKVLDKIVVWLEEEIDEGQEFVDAYENSQPCITSDGTDLIMVGRHECAEGLLSQIRKWEGGDE